MNNKIALESLVMDLKRVSLGYQTNSLKMADRFYEEALKRSNEVDTSIIKEYLKNILKNVHQLKDAPPEKIAEDALMYSTLIQNYTQTNL